jgi:hypothetical protein
MAELPLGSGAEQTFIEQVPAHIAVFDCEMRYLAVSQRFLSDMARLFATEVFTPGEVIGLSHYQMFPNMPPCWRDIHTRAGLEREVESMTRGRARQLTALACPAGAVAAG